MRRRITEKGRTRLPVKSKIKPASGVPTTSPSPRITYRQQAHHGRERSSPQLSVAMDEFEVLTPSGSVYGTEQKARQTRMDIPSHKQTFQREDTEIAARLIPTIINPQGKQSRSRIFLTVAPQRGPAGHRNPSSG